MFQDLSVLDNLRLNFSEAGLVIMNIAIGFMMFGVALDIKIEHLNDVVRNPRKVIIGLISQFVVLPALTFLMVWALGGSITASVAFGMILVAACPGGNVSNFITSLAKANVALAVSLTAIGTVLAIVMTPFNFALWGKLYSATSPLLRPIEIDPLDMFRTVFIILGIPVVGGILIAKYFPELTRKIHKWVKRLSVLVFAAFVVAAFANNFSFFVKYIKWIFLIVLIHNTLAMVTGYWFSKFFKFNRIDRRTISIETGIHNTGLGLALIFNPRIFPPELHIGGMAFIAAWWGIWHILSGVGVATIWSYIRPVDKLKN